MKLYEVNQEIESIFEQMVDPETGEILEASDELMTQLDSLQMERDRILEYLAKLVLNTRSGATALKEEELRLKKRRETLSKKEERIMDILDRECGGVKTDLGVATLSYRKTEKIEVSDQSTAIEWFKSKGFSDCLRIPEPEISKSEAKKVIKAGNDIPGIELVSGMSCSLR
ncbi:MAG: siphovirus Gp157 family protein [Oscillospiraceae bacterium]|nr:siphovirus Gp157 family protein [Oscillospiraceae bacterium]